MRSEDLFLAVLIGLGSAGVLTALVYVLDRLLT